MKLLLSKNSKDFFNQPFEQELITSAYSHLNDLRDPYRCNIFALLLRELIRMVMLRLAPDEKILKASWYKSEQEQEQVTRSDRYRFAITGYLSDDIIKNHPEIDSKAIRQKLIKSIDTLSKYTHISPGTTNLSIQESIEFCEKVENIIDEYSEYFINSKQYIENCIYQLSQDAIEKSLFNYLPDELLELSTQTIFENAYVHEVNNINLSYENPVISGNGIVEVELNYGRNDDEGFTINDSYPFSFKAELDSNTFTVIDISISINTRSFYE